MTKEQALLLLKQKLLNKKSLPLYKNRVQNKYQLVFGEGNCKSKIIFIGEAPGKKEALSGRPFCGKAGAILDKNLKKINIKRENVYVTNIIKDRPPKNRDPLPEEISAYSYFLDEQIKIIRPKIIVSLGRFSSHYILKKYNKGEEIKPITHLHANIINLTTEKGIIKLLPFFHPASVIYDKKKEKLLEEGFLHLKKIMEVI